MYSQSAVPCVPSARKLGASDGRTPEVSCLAPLIEEFIPIARLVVTTASIAIVQSKQSEQLQPRALHSYLPCSPTVYPAISHLLTNDSAFREIAPSLREFYDRMTCLRGLTICYCLASGDEASSSAEFERLASGWQDVARAAISVAAKMRQAMPAGSRGAHALDNLRAALEGIVHGEPQIIDTEGALDDVRPEQRLTHRIQAARQVFLGVGDSIQRALVTDASTRGIGIWGIGPCEAGQHVEILWGPGKSVTGTVIWYKDRRCGIVIDERNTDGESLVLDLLNDRPVEVS